MSGEAWAGESAQHADTRPVEWTSQRKAFGKPLNSQAVVRGKLAGIISEADARDLFKMYAIQQHITIHLDSTVIQLL